MNKKVLLSLIFIILFAIIFLLGYYIYLISNENEDLKNKINTLSSSNSTNTIPEDTTNSTLNQTDENTLANNEISSENSVAENTTAENVTSENIIVDSPSVSSYNGYCLRSGYLRDIDTDKFIIKNLSELQNFYKKYALDAYKGALDSLLGKYNDSYFNNQSLAIKYVELTSGGDTIDFIRATKNNNSISINYKLDTSKGFTDDMSGYLVIVEVGKDITEIL